MIETPDKLSKIALKRLRLCHDGAGREMGLERDQPGWKPVFRPVAL
jgi:hypothetical protein